MYTWMGNFTTCAIIYGQFVLYNLPFITTSPWKQNSMQMLVKKRLRCFATCPETLGCLRMLNEIAVSESSSHTLGVPSSRRSSRFSSCASSVFMWPPVAGAAVLLAAFRACRLGSFRGGGGATGANAYTALSVIPTKRLSSRVSTCLMFISLVAQRNSRWFLVALAVQLVRRSFAFAPCT